MSLPATEAMCERCFSQIKAILTDFNRSMKKDLFTALGTIKMCICYDKNYYFANLKDENNIEEEDYSK